MSDMAGNVIIMRQVAEIPHSHSLAEALASLAIAAARLSTEKRKEYSIAAAEAGSARADHSGDVVRDRVGGRPDAAAVGQDFNKVR